jgi:DNA-binding NarL/FixJ family response regulator
MNHRRSAASRIQAVPQTGENAFVRVLIVDDHPSFRSSARSLLEAEGYDVVGEAADGAEAIAAAAELEPDLVLLDVQLPDIDGFEVARLLAESTHPPQVVLTSSRDGADYGASIDEAKARGFVPKAELSGAALAVLLG